MTWLMIKVPNTFVFLVSTLERSVSRSHLVKFLLYPLLLSIFFVCLDEQVVHVDFYSLSYSNWSVVHNQFYFNWDVLMRMVHLCSFFFLHFNLFFLHSSFPALSIIKVLVWNALKSLHTKPQDCLTGNTKISQICGGSKILSIRAWVLLGLINSGTVNCDVHGFLRLKDTKRPKWCEETSKADATLILFTSIYKLHILWRYPVWLDIPARYRVNILMQHHFWRHFMNPNRGIQQRSKLFTSFAGYSTICEKMHRALLCDKWLSVQRHCQCPGGFGDFGGMKKRTEMTRLHLPSAHVATRLKYIVASNCVNALGF